MAADNGANLANHANPDGDAGGAGAAPQGETQDITAYNSATGVFTTNPFTAPGVGIGDDMIILKLAIPVVIWFPLL